MLRNRKLVGEKCYLSPLVVQDATKWAEWFNDLSVCIPLGDEAYVPTSLLRETESIESMIRLGEHFFSIVAVDGDKLIGRCGLFSVDHINQMAMLGIVIGENDHWGNGFGTEATRLLLDYGFNLLNLHSIMLGAISFNERAINCYRRVGFKEIGRRRQARLLAGRRYDAVFMDILADEFESPYVGPLIDRMGDGAAE